MMRAEWDAIAVDSAKKETYAQELLQLKKKEEDKWCAKAKALIIPAAPSTIQVQAHKAVEGGEMDEAIPVVPSEVCLHIQKLLTLAKTTKS